LSKRVFVTRTFARWMSKAGLTEAAIQRAVLEMLQGLIDADLGGNLVKKRVALPGHGKRGGARTIVARRSADHWFFLYGFNKNERGDLARDELRALREVGNQLLELDDQQLAIALGAGEIMELSDENQKA